MIPCLVGKANWMNLMSIEEQPATETATTPSAATQRQTFHVHIDMTETAAFGVDVTAPLYGCRRCGKEHLPRKELRWRATGAMVKALRSAGVGR